MKFHKISAAVREPILSAGQVDAVAGFSYLSAVNLRDRGVPGGRSRRASICRLRLRSLGFAVWSTRHSPPPSPTPYGIRPRLDRGHQLRPSRTPVRAADEAASRIDDGDRELELERLRTVLVDNILTDEVKRNGLGGIEPARLERSIDQIAQDYKFRKRPGRAISSTAGFCRRSKAG